MDYPVLHISNVALPKNAPQGKIYLLATMGKQGQETVKDLTLATLQKDKVESVALDLYVNVSQQVVLSVSGAQGAELHLSGFFEPQREGEDEGMFMDGEDEDEDASDEEQVAGKQLKQSLQQAKANAAKNVAAAKGGDSDEDDDLDEDDYDDEDLEDDEEEEDESEEELPKGKAVAPAKAAGALAAIAAPVKPAAAPQKPAEQPKKEAAPAKPAAAPQKPVE